MLGSFSPSASPNPITPGSAVVVSGGVDNLPPFQGDIGYNYFYYDALYLSGDAGTHYPTVETTYTVNAVWNEYLYYYEEGKGGYVEEFQGPGGGTGLITVYMNSATIQSWTLTGPSDLNNVPFGTPMTLTGTFTGATSGLIQNVYVPNLN